jgi:serine/threonine-protein kinase
MSPEQCNGASPIDHRADIYALGVMLFEMLAGRPPFVADGLGELFALHMFQPAPALADLAPHVPPHVAAAVMKALAKAPDDRFQSMDELRAALVRPGELEATATLPAASLAGPAPRSRGWKMRAVVVSIATAALIVYAVLPASHPHASPPAPSLAQPAPKMVAFRFESDPVGAHVFDAKGNDLGQTPLEVSLQRDSAVHDYVLRLAGHREISLAAVPDANRTLHVLLARLAATSAPADAAKHPVRHHVKKSGLSLDEYDLAKPSF